MHIAPGQRAYSPQGTKFWCQQKCLVTSVICCLFQIIDDNSFWGKKIPYKSIRDQILPCRKIGQGQPRVIIWTKLVVLEDSMLHTKIQGHRPFGSGEEIFKVFTIYGHGGHLGHVTWTIWTTFLFSRPKEALYEIWLQSARWFQRKRCLKMLTYNTHTDDRGLPLL